MRGQKFKEVLRGKLCTDRVMNICNELQEEVEDSDTISAFKSDLDRQYERN